MSEETRDYIHYFNTQNEFLSAHSEDNYYEPWVSYTDENSVLTYNKSHEDIMMETPLTFEITSVGNIRFKAESDTFTLSIEYSKNGGTWTSLTSATGDSAPSISVASGDTVQFRGNNPRYGTSGAIYNSFSGSTCGFNVYGNIMSLSYGQNFSANTSIASAYTFFGLFRDCTGLTDVSSLMLPATKLWSYCYQYMFNGCASLNRAPKLPATTLAGNCYAYMFAGCASLVTAPRLPATTLASTCYAYMFMGCASLVDAPELPATTLANTCYAYMFYNCSSLLSAPELPATTLFYRCYFGMFRECTSLILSPDLPATTLAESCYQAMFQGCISLVSVPELPAETLATGCYATMFNGCTNLTTAPALPATTLANSCYASMFGGCTSLAYGPSRIGTSATTMVASACTAMFSACTSLLTAPELPATTTAPYCYGYMFRGCSSLTTAQAILPATALSDYCYSAMFYECSSLTNAPELPATATAPYCYNAMFYRCLSLETAPELPATILTERCYYVMFYYCTKIDYLKCLATDISAANATTNWFGGVTTYGTFVCAPFMENVWPTGVNGIPTRWTAIADYTDVPLTFEVFSGGNIYWRAENSAATPMTIEYSKNGGDWISITSASANPPTISVVSGDTVQFRGNNPTYTILVDNYPYFNGFYNSSCGFNLKGNIMSLIDSQNFTDIKSFDTAYTHTFYEFFYYCNGLKDASNLILPATTLTSYCYSHMFRNSGIVNLPDLPATTLTSYCYSHMFRNCTSLTTIPNNYLPATTLRTGCYYSMFAGCTSLTTAPELPATSLDGGCYRSMFYGCTSLTSAPELPATILTLNCYYDMFGGCTNLTTAPELPATTLTTQCYYGMFSGCRSLTTAPELPATTLATNCYQNMFNGCTNLIAAPELPATTISVNAYCGMFGGCTSLTTAPELPATTLADNCYESMFSNCTNLIAAPELPATTLTNYCYRSMFSGCSSLATAPELPATALTGGCYVNMFNGCTNLCYIECYATTNVTTANTQNWVNGVAASGTFVKDSTTTWTTGNHGIPINWISGSFTDIPLTFQITSAGDIIWKAQNTAYTATIQYSKNGGIWTNITSNTGTSAPSVSVVAGDTFQFKGDNANYSSGSSRYNSFSGTTCGFNAKGNIMSLVNSTGFSAETSLQSAFTFTSLLRNCTGLTDVSRLVLPATSLTESCYRDMLDNTNITQAPKLPATTLANYCYYRMFDGCTNLITAPELPATILAESCYATMFNGCTNLITAPELPATILAESCYDNMFRDCTSLTIALELPATTLATNCYRLMFYRCTGLITAPELPATILASGCYYGMFQGCTSLTTAPALPATTLANSCYQAMFGGCTNLITAPELTTTTLAQSCYYSMFSGCTSLTTAPELPATTLTTQCYYGMFSGCRSLTTAPELPATTLATNCYQNMFKDCTNLNYIKCLATTNVTTTNTYGWVNGVASAGTFEKDTSMTAWTTGNNGIPTGWVTEDNLTEQPLTFTVISAGTINWKVSGTTPQAKTIQYSKNGGAWTDFTSTTAGTSISVAAGDVVQFKGDNPYYASGGSSQVSYNTFSGTTCIFNIKGNIMSLIDSTNFATLKTLSTANTFTSLFWYTKAYDASCLVFPATSLTIYCYDRVFQGCSILERGPIELPAHTSSSFAYRLMFYACPKLTETPILRATTLGTSCYESMFRSCTGLKKAPELPAKTLATQCYRYMFSGCTALEAPPSVLPGETVEYMSYYCMFMGDRNITTTPAILAKAIGTYGCVSMFNGCSKLNHVKCMATEIIPDVTSMENWLLNVASAGTFEKHPDMNDWVVNSPDGIPSGWTVIDSNMSMPLTFDILTNGEIKWTSIVSGTSAITRIIEYNKNGEGWKSITPIVDVGNSIPVSAGDVVQFRGNNTSYAVAPNVYNGFVGTTCEFNVRGNAFSLIDKENYLTITALSSVYVLSSLFRGCTTLKSAKYLVLPALNIGNRVYYCMFYGCTNLVDPPVLPATGIGTYCYFAMFYGCTKLTTAPELPATTLAEGCYDSMFQSCTNLKEAPALPVANVSKRAYRQMFRGCSNLNHIKCLATNITAVSATTNWTLGVASSGTFEKHPDMSGWTTDGDGIPAGWNSASDPKLYPLTFLIASAGSITWKATTTAVTRTIQYSKNGGAWTDFTSTTAGTSISVAAGDKLEFKGANNRYGTTASNFSTFGPSSAKFEVCGNIMSLISGATYQNAEAVVTNYVFAYLFSGCTGLYSAKELYLPQGCYDCTYQGTFANSGLIDAPKLRAKSVGYNGYYMMFAFTPLTTAPELPANILHNYSYQAMFRGCTGLTVAPELSTSIQIAPGCYLEMFYACTNLVSGITSIGTSKTEMVESACWNMFVGCTSLAVAPELPAKILKGRCYSGMFYGCSSLNRIKCLATDISATYCTTSWVVGVAANGTFVKDANTTWGTGTSAIPSGWAVENE